MIRPESHRCRRRDREWFRPSRGIHDRDNELHDCARRVKFAGIACRIAHLPEHGFIEQAKGVNLILGGEVDFVDLVHDIAQQIAVRHAIEHALKDGGNHVAAVTVGTAKRTKISE